MGKYHVAHGVACSLFEPCLASSDESLLCKQALKDGVLEIDFEEYIHSSDEIIKEKVVDHIFQRGLGGLGAVVVFKHMNHSRPSLFTDIAKVLSGESNTLSYISSKGFQIEANCNGTLFLFTSRWGSKSIFGQLEKNGCVVELNQSELIPSIIDEVNEESRSHLADVSARCILFFYFFSDYSITHFKSS